MAKKLKLQQERAVIPAGNSGLGAKTVTSGENARQIQQPAPPGPARHESEAGHEQGRQQLPQAAFHLVANWLLRRAGEFDNQLI
jgi:hypothetical protein